MCTTVVIGPAILIGTAGAPHLLQVPLRVSSSYLQYLPIHIVCCFGTKFTSRPGWSEALFILI